MRKIYSDNSLLQLSEFIASNLALNFPQERWNDLERNIESAAKGFGFNDIGNFIYYIISSPLTRTNIETLASYLTIGETYFWGEPKTFDALEKTIISELVEKRKNGDKRIRIWSAGCSTGEEPYSIAIALKKAIPDIKEWNISILATDINPRSFLKAKTGEYSQWSFRGNSEWLKLKYFSPKPNNRFEIIPEIKNMVKYEYLNLAEDTYPSSINGTNALDIVFCRNVLMYFTQDRFRKVVQGLYSSLLPDGYLVVSASELSQQNFVDFTPRNIHGMIFYQKKPTSTAEQYKAPIEERSPEPTKFQRMVEYEINTEKTPVISIKTESKELIPDNTSLPLLSFYEESLKAYSQGNYAEVVDDLNRDQQTPEEQLLFIRALANQGKLKKALQVCKKVDSENKLNPRFQYLYATILQENNQPEEAIISLKRAIYLDSDFVLAYYFLGNIYLQLDDAETAKKYFEIAVSILNNCKQEDILFESEGINTGRFREIINTYLQKSTF